ncbi:hepatitis A virus cellular receptor 1 homolog [Archocentrus centrarchus]|uniref:hepatitis A virus cellular receptor 1 homolog n=1 Tax=Archocentrus centrarchus TaxID=63155 RepID=UPI0011E9FF15|nr:hepatitis A virus cellular receptor 1 homolog [Archocentrus centrarchus]
MKLVLLLALLAASECDSTKVKGQTGQDVTLSCKYDRKYYGALSVCWGRGEIPNSGCYNQLISSDGDRVETRASSRYELLGRLEDGDISLTILNLTEGDAGRYGCRVAIPGWFNDEKHHFDLTVVTAPRIHTSPASNTETPSEPTTAAQTEGHMTSSESLSTSSSSMTKSSEEEDSSQLIVVVLCTLLGLLFLLSIVGIIMVRKLKLLNKIPQQLREVGSSIRFNSTSSTLQLHAQSTRCGQHLPDGRRAAKEVSTRTAPELEAPPTYLLNLEV